METSILISKPRVSPLTFGIEIEMAIATKSVHHPDQHPNDPRSIDLFNEEDNDPRPVDKHVVSTLQRAGLEAEIPSKNKAQNSWIVQGDGSLRAPVFKEKGVVYEWVDIEVSSPAYVFGLDALKAVQTVCEALTATYRININSTMGLHVHVGDGFRGFPMNTIKNFIAIVWCFESQIEEIHPLSRRDNGYCLTLRRRCGLQEDLTADGTLIDIREGLERILAVENYDQLFQMASSWYRLAYHLGDVQAKLGVNDAKRTIEFRQHKGTVRWPIIKNWLQFTVRLVTFADTIEQDKLFPWLRECIGKSPEEYSLQDMLWKMNMGDLVLPFTWQIEKDKEYEESEDLVVIYKNMSKPRRVDDWRGRAF